ncbi:hypothetical protein ACLI09_00970 [Flavobacterium sp. RHBU_24]|uniref:hypothetical protein n=1 Tax=Flavobacterium sp. RHBU_24 TaxID=3391185 RepID=UPI003984F786
MKKLFLTAAFMLALAGTATAQTDNKVETTPPATTAPGTTTDAVIPATQTPDANTTAVAASTDGDKEFAAVKQSEIAPAVLKEAVAKYTDYALVEALAATDGSEYKLVLTKDGKDIAAYYKANGEFIKEVAA